MKTVLFVCVGNAGRSQMAEAFFNQLARGKAKALSAGTNPAANVEPTVVKVMKEVGIDISGNKPKPLTPEMIDQANLVVTHGLRRRSGLPGKLGRDARLGAGRPQGQTYREGEGDQG